MERLLVLAGLTALLGLLVAGGRLLALRSRRRLAAADAAHLWEALGASPDGRPTVVAFSTPSCAACHTAQRPALAALRARAGEEVRVLDVDATERPEAARAFGILTVRRPSCWTPRAGRWRPTRASRRRIAWPPRPASG